MIRLSVLQSNPEARLSVVQESVSLDMPQLAAVPDHRFLSGRNAPDQHPMSSIIGLEEALEHIGRAEFETDDTLTLEDGVLRVNTAKDVEQDNTLPVTSAAVFVEIGNIDALLQTI